MTRFVLYLVLSCCFEIAFQIPSTENFRYVAKASDRSSCPSVFRFRGGYGGDGWKAGEQDDGLLNFEDEEDSKERRMYEEDDLDNPDLDRETFGGDLDSGETDDAWENMVQQSLSLRNQYKPPVPMPEEQSLQRSLVEPNKSRWLPDGENTSPSTILDNLMELWHERERLVEQYKADGRRGTVPSLEDLFQQKYPEDAHDLNECTSEGGLDYDIPPRWSPFPLESMFGSAYMMRGMHGDVPKKILPNSMWEHDSEYDEGGIEQIWEYDDRPNPPPMGYWDEMGMFHPTFERPEHRETKRVIQAQPNEVSQVQMPRMEITWSDLVRMTNTEKIENDGVELNSAFSSQPSVAVTDVHSKLDVHSKPENVREQVVETGSNWRHKEAAYKKKENFQTRKDPLSVKNEKIASNIQDKENMRKSGETSSNKVKASKENHAEKRAPGKKEKPNDSEHEERPGKSQFLNVPSDRSEKQSMTVKPVANISSTNAPRQLESLNSFSALNDAASQLNQDGNSDQETVKGNESQATDQKSKKTKASDSKGKTAFDEDYVTLGGYLHKLKHECKRMSISQLSFFFHDAITQAPSAIKMAWEEAEQNMPDEAAMIKTIFGNFLNGSVTWKTIEDFNMLYAPRETEYLREGFDQVTFSHHRHDLAALLSRLSAASPPNVSWSDLRILVALSRCALGAESQTLEQAKAEAENGLKFVSDEPARFLNCYLQYSFVTWSRLEKIARASLMIRVLDDMLVNLTLGGGQNETDKLLHRDLQIAIRLAQAEFYAFGENNVSKAEGAYELLLKQNDRLDVSLAFCLFLLMKKKDYHSALEVAKNAFRRYPLSNEMIDVFLELLCTHHVEVGGERDPVYDDVAVALEGRVRGGEGSSFMISAFARISSSELAMEKLQESLAMRPNDETLWIARAYIEEWKGRQKEAEEFILHALALSPRHGFLLARAGTSALKFRGNPFTCSNFLEQAIRQGYKSPEVLSAYVFCSSLGASTEDISFKSLRKILALDPTEPFTTFALSDLLLFQDETKEAERLVTSALKLSRNKKFQCCLHGLYGQVLTDLKCDESRILEEYHKAMEISQGGCAHAAKLYCGHRIKHECAGNVMDVNVAHQIEDIFQKAFSINPLHVHLALSYADFRERVLGDKSGARRVHEIALQNNPDDAWMTYGFASFIERHDGFTDNCKKLFIRSLELAPQFGLAASAYAVNLHHLTDMKDEAEAAYIRAMEISPSDAEIYSNYAVFLEEEKKDIRNAQTFYLRSISLDPQNPEARFLYACMLHDRMRDFPQAKKEYEKMISLNPSNAKYLCKYARLLDENDDVKGAEAAYQAALSMDPTFVDAYVNLANLYLEVGESYEKSEVLYERALELNSTHVTALCSYAIMTTSYLRNLRYSGMAGDPELPKLKKQLHARALGHFEKAYSLEPNSPAVLFNFASFLREQKEDFDRAESMVHKAMAMEPNDVNCIILLAHILRDSRKDPAEAVRLYRKATEMDPTHLARMMQYGTQFLSDKETIGEAEILLSSLLSSPNAFQENIRWVQSFSSLGSPSANKAPIPLAFSDAAQEARKELHRRREQRKIQEEVESSWQQQQRERDAEAIARQLIEEEEMQPKKGKKKSSGKKNPRSKH